MDLADVKPSILSWVTVGLMSVTFIAFMRYMLIYFPLPGLTTLFAAV